jgi:hypothetical protein
MDSQDRAGALFFSALWACVAGLLVLLALGGLSSRASAIAVIAVATGLGSLYSALGAALGKPRRIGTGAGLALTAFTALAVFVEVLAGLASDS